VRGALRFARSFKLPFPTAMDVPITMFVATLMTVSVLSFTLDLVAGQIDDHTVLLSLFAARQRGSSAERGVW
jgi:hypothetical protein